MKDINWYLSYRPCPISKITNFTVFMKTLGFQKINHVFEKNTRVKFG